MKRLLLSTILIGTTFLNSAQAQTFKIGQRLTPSSTEFKSLGASSSTMVYTYKYSKPISKTMYDRKVGDIVIGVKSGYIVSTIYYLIPLSTDKGLPQSVVKLFESSLGFSLAYVNGMYGANIDDKSYSISRTTSEMTFQKDRIMVYTTIKNSILSR
ncbi:hypothetical protein DBR32_04285 [Taibaiella sp. KBW10]|uniref:hypothetical protein n=1 Tax=Taibaiella sp. KBW10 TaxID=2153357 RepID=UPI000F591B8F|nr:hypothetical protein [Taibaiella sp. KBW10]RQO32025.1 hypothetical protein DBR32_04285 [Taibaiella sp. KBW10]